MGPPGDYRFGGAAACPGSARRGRGRKRPIDLDDGKRVSVDDNVQAHENRGCGRAPHFGPYLLRFAPDGQIRGLPVQPLLQKYSGSLFTQITCICFTVSSHRGAARDRHGRGAGCDGRKERQRRERSPCGRRSRVVLTPRRWRQVGESDFTGDGGNKARSPGRARRNPLKPLRREGRVFR
jgi:hypothetical protein